MNANVKIEKSFDNGRELCKRWEQGDFAEFFTDEGQYLDKLAGILDVHGKDTDTFTVTYTITLTK